MPGATLHSLIALATLGSGFAWAEEGVAADGETDPAGTAEEVVVVTGTRTAQPRGEAPVAVEVIDRQDLEDSGALTLDEALQEHPGLDISYSYLGATVRMLGMAPEHVLILVDGQRVVGRTGGAVDLSRYGVSGIERVEIVKGPSSALYGSDAMAGVIHIITRGASEPLSADVGVQVASRRTVGVQGHVGVARERWSASLYASGQLTDGYDLEPKDVATTGDAVRLAEGGGSVSLRLTPDWRLTGRSSYLIQDSRGIDASSTGAVFDRRNLTEVGDASLAAEGFLGPRIHLQATAYGTVFRDQYDSDQRDSEALDAYEETREQLGQLSVQANAWVGERHHLSAGVEGAHEQMVSDRLGAGGGDRQRLAVYAQDAWQVLDSPKLVLLPGARVDLDSWYGAFPTPKLSLRFDPVDRVVVRAGYGWGYRAPSFKELLLWFENPGVGYAVTGNPDLEPETSRGGTLSVEATPREGLWLSAGVFRNDLRNLITIGTLEEPDAGSPTLYGYVNVAEALTQGGELNARLALPWGVRADVGYALTYTLDKQLERPLEGRALHRGTASVSWAHPGWGTRAVVRSGLVGPRAFYVDQDGDGLEDRVDTAPYATLDARLELTVLRDAATLSAGVENLLDAGDTAWLPMPPRTFTLGLQGRFPWEARPTETLLPGDTP